MLCKLMKPRGGLNLDFWTQAISYNWDEYDQEETTTQHLLRRTESGQNNRTSIGCNVEGGGVGGNQAVRAGRRIALERWWVGVATDISLISKAGRK